MHRRLTAIGHTSNEAGNTLMAHTWFECAYAAKASSGDLLSATNMRLKLGQWALADELYKQIVRMELSDAQREVCPHPEWPRAQSFAYLPHALPTCHLCHT